MVLFNFSEGAIRLIVFASVFILMALAETLFPRKARSQGRGHRWLTNWALVILDTVALRVVVPVLTVGMAEIATRNGWGLMAWVSFPLWAEIIVAVILLDMAVYGQHVAFHKIAPLWRIHKVHHADRDIDVTTGVRFHPIEILLSMLFKLACVVVLGPASIAVFLFEVILNASAMFNHANLKLPLGFDRAIRVLIVTPDMHRVHHSVIQEETDSNYGFFLSVWDRIFKTYTAQPKAGHDEMLIGIAAYQDEKPASLIWSLILPFKSASAVNVGNSNDENAEEGKGKVKERNDIAEWFFFHWISVISIVVISIALVFFVGRLMIREEPGLDKIHKQITVDYEQVQHIDAASFAELDASELVVFDVRQHQEYAVSHLSGAVQIDPDISAQLFEEKYGSLLQGKRAVFYCSVGRRSSELAERVADIVDAKSDDAPYNLAGGLFNWRNENRSLVQSSGTPTDQIHPFNAYWGRLITDKNAIQYSPAIKK